MRGGQARPPLFFLWISGARWGLMFQCSLSSWQNYACCARAAGVYGLTYTAYILKLVLVDGVGLFNPAGGYVWAGLFGAAGVAALTA